MLDTNFTLTGKRKRAICLYNVQQYSDIVVTFSNRRVFAHKVILAGASLFFHRAFSSGFAVASNPEIDLGDDDDPDQVEVMLRIMYDDDSVQKLNTDYRDSKLTETFLRYYVLGDKYDVPILRHEAKDLFLHELENLVQMRCDPEWGEKVWSSEKFEHPAKCIGMVLGPSAITFGDSSIQEDTLDWCAENLDYLLWQRTFRKILGKGQILSTEFAGRLILKKARLDRVEFGWDLDNGDVYDHSSADEDATQSEDGDDDDDDDGDGDDGEDDNDDSNDNDNTQVRGNEVEE